MTEQKPKPFSRGTFFIKASVGYQYWGTLALPSYVIHKFQAYAYDQNSKSELCNESVQFEYTYKFEEFSFTQGNAGNIRYLNKWKRTPKADGDSSKPIEKIKVFNIEAEKVYNYDYYAPNIRRFALTHNLLFNTLVKEFLPLFYAQYMHQYLFKNISMVQSRIFTPLGIDGTNIYTNNRYGLDNPEKIVKWIKLGDKFNSSGVYAEEFYLGAISELNLSTEEMLYIAGPQSTIQGLLKAIKGAITAKLNMISDDYCTGICTDEQMILAQLSVGLLTQQNIFPTVLINKSIDQFNLTLFDSIQYSTFCLKRPNLKNCSGETNSDAVGFFGNRFLFNYTEVENIFNNLNNPEAIEQIYDIHDEGQSMIEYVKFLYNHTFNLPLHKLGTPIDFSSILPIKYQQKPTSWPEKSMESEIQLQISADLDDSNLNIEAFKKSFTNYNHIQPVIEIFSNLLSVELYSRAYYNNFIEKSSPQCEDYYTGDFEAYKKDCQDLPLKTLANLRVYIRTYLGIDSSEFMNKTTIKDKSIFSFLHNSSKSRFAKEINEVAADLAAQYNCTSNKMCGREELLFKQWKNGFIMNNLPSKYFAGRQESIRSWDSDKILNGIEPQLYKFVTLTEQFNPQNILNSKTGIYSLFNLIKVYSSPNGTNYPGISNYDLLYYLQTIAIQIGFKGIYIEQSPQEFFTSHQSQIINQKRSMNPLLGGAPWLSPNISAIKMENNPKAFNYINSGIYDSQKLRSLSMIQNSLYSSSTYQVYSSENEDVTVTFTNSNKIKGTNLFGFQTKIQQHDLIEGYFDFIYQSHTLQYKNTELWKDSEGLQIQSFRFEFDKSTNYTINVQEFTNRTIELTNQTFFIVEPNTGLTLEMYIKYIVYSKPFFIEYYQRGENLDFPLYQGQIHYVNGNAKNLAQIQKDTQTQKVLFLLSIILSSVFIVTLVIMLFVYRRSKKVKNFREQKQSLIDSEVSSEILSIQK